MDRNKNNNNSEWSSNKQTDPKQQYVQSRLENFHHSNSNSSLEISDASSDADMYDQYQSTSQSEFRVLGDESKSARVVNFDLNAHTQQREGRSRKQHVHLHHFTEEDGLLLNHPAYNDNGKDNNWMTRIAYAFRSPRSNERRGAHHRRSSSGLVLEYPHSICRSSSSSQSPQQQYDATYHNDAEFQPMIRKDSKSWSNPLLATPTGKSEKDAGKRSAKYVAIAAAFLQDYEANRPPSLSLQMSEHSDWELKWHQFKFGFWFSSLCVMATFALFLSSLLEGGEYRHLLSALNFFAVAVFAMDLWIRHQLRGGEPMSDRHNGDDNDLTTEPLSLQDPRQRDSRSGKLVKPLILFGLVLCYENLIRLVLTDTPDGMVLYSSFFKPLVLFYVSYQARDALESLRRIFKTVTRVIVMELLMILMFAAVAVRLFGKFEEFHNLSTAWLSLFELSTTVVNPSIWMPMYEHTRYSAVFFISFIVTSVFYLHSLVLSVVFQTYVHAATTIHERSVADRENCVHLAYVALKHESRGGEGVDVELVRRTLGVLRPHYNHMKINALVDIVDPTGQKFIDYSTFRTKIRQALNASIRTTRSTSTIALSVEILAVVLAIVNFIYVILVSSTFDQKWFDDIQEIVGIVITIFAGFELIVRFNPLNISQFTPLTRLNPTFDGLALVGALTSCIGIVLHITKHPSALDLVLMGRAIDMARVMRFFSIFRDVVRRSTDVFPALTGPIVLLVTTLHGFAYFGMALWGGSIHVGTYGDSITSLYDLNNFNSYQEGLVTMFQIIVVNDWHAIAKVFTYADRCSSPYIVYPFFVLSNLIGVSIMLNVLTAFFVESFVTNIDSEEDHQPNRNDSHKSLDMSIRTSENTPIKRFSSMNESADVPRNLETSSVGSYTSELVEFDVYEREGFDKIMQTVTGVSGASIDLARDLSKYLEIYERLSPERDKVGYLICDQQTLERYGNSRFQKKTEGFVDADELHVIVSDMHAELLAVSSQASFREKSLIRSFTHRDNPELKLEISGALLRQYPALSVFVCHTPQSQS